MNKILIILSLVLLAACSSKETPYENLVARQGIIYKVNSQTPFTGVATTYHENGLLMTKGNWKDGKQSGLFESYQENGQLAYKIIVEDGKQHGLYESYHENGQLSLRVNYKDGKEDGLEEEYNESGDLLFKSCYKYGETTDMSYCEK